MTISQLIMVSEPNPEEFKLKLIYYSVNRDTLNNSQERVDRLIDPSPASKFHVLAMIGVHRPAPMLL
ncbi:hypothetical protein [Lysobacter gummosus]|uniref:hypothetical protein n=1 Tax=Lysobacter gummosus TaxID=262324 RepID=UPI003633E11C